MKRALIALALGLALWGALAAPAQAQLGVGVKVPPLIPPHAFASLGLSEALRMEASVMLAGGGFGANALLKLYLGELDLGGLALYPFAGAGGAFFTGSVLGFSFSVMSATALAGMEYRLPDTPFALFGELGASLWLSGAGMGFGVGGSVGARFDFGPAPAALEASE